MIMMIFIVMMVMMFVMISTMIMMMVFIVMMVIMMEMQVTSIYYKEMVELLKKATGAEHVEMFHHQVLDCKLLEILDVDLVDDDTNSIKEAFKGSRVVKVQYFADVNC